MDDDCTRLLQEEKAEKIVTINGIINGKKGYIEMGDDHVVVHIDGVDDINLSYYDIVSWGSTDTLWILDCQKRGRGKTRIQIIPGDQRTGGECVSIMRGYVDAIIKR